MLGTFKHSLFRWSCEIVLFTAALSLNVTRSSAATTAYVPARDGVWALDTTNNAVVTNIPLPQTAEQMAVTPNGKFAYVTMPETTTGEPSNAVAVVSTETNNVIANVTVGESPRGVAITPNGQFVYVANSGWSSVWVIATATNTIAATITTGNGPYEVVITPDGAFAYVTNILSDSVSVIDTTTNTVVNTIPVGSHPHQLAMSPNGAMAYVSNTAGNSISIIDTATRAVVKTIPLKGAHGLAVTPDGRYLYATAGTYYTGYVVVALDPVSGGVAANIPLLQSNYLGELAISPDGTHVYVSNADTTVSVISTATNTITGSISVSLLTGPVVFAPPANQPVTLSSITLNASTLAGGDSTTGTVLLTAAAPVGGASVSLSSNDASTSVPASVTVAAGSKIATFAVTTSSVSAATVATITASYMSVSKTASLSVTPAGQSTLSSVSVNPMIVTSGGSATGTVTLSGPAPSGGMVIDLWTNGSPAFVPTSVAIPAGSTSASFAVTTNYVTSTSQGIITAFYNGLSKTATITVSLVPTLVSVSATSQSIPASFTGTGQVTLSAPAPAGGMVVYLWTNGSPAFVPTSVTVAAGSLVGTFPITTIYVSTPTQGTITAFYNGLSKTATVTVTP